MLVVGLGDHDMILGRKWFVHTGVLIDCKNRRLIWPDGQPRTTRWDKIITTTKENLEPRNTSSKHQQDADHRDKLMAISTSWRPQVLKRETTNPEIWPRTERKTWKQELTERYKKMRANLDGKLPCNTPSSTRPIKQRSEKQRKPTIDICGISTAAFWLNLRKEENTFFTTSLFEITRELEARELEARELEVDHKDPQRPDETELEWLRRTLPTELIEYADVFS